MSDPVPLFRAKTRRNEPFLWRHWADVLLLHALVVAASFGAVFTVATARGRAAATGA